MPNPSENAAAELRNLAARIDAHRRRRSPVPSDRALVKIWPGLGSAKTWSRILKGDLAEIDVDRQLVNYRGVAAALEASSREVAQEELYDDLTPALAVSLPVLQLLHHHGKDRLILIEGGSGSGKTSALDILESGDAAGSMRRIEADETWKSLRAALGDILRGIGMAPKNIPVSTAERLTLLLGSLQRQGRILIAIDEAHHCTGAVLNVLKTLLNRTEVLILLAGMNTLLRKLRTAASEEAKQLVHNRLFARVELSAPDSEAAGLFLSRRLGVDQQWSPATLRQLVKLSANAGHWAFLRRVADRLRGQKDLADADLLQAASQATDEIA